MGFQSTVSLLFCANFDFLSIYRNSSFLEVESSTHRKETLQTVHCGAVESVTGQERVGFDRNSDGKQSHENFADSDRFITQNKLKRREVAL